MLKRRALQFPPKQSLILLPIAILLFVVSPVVAQFTIKENFRTNAVSSSVIMGGSPTAFLTSGVVDPVNDGWLRLTNSNGNQKGFAYINSTFPSTLGALIDFEYKVWRSASDAPYNGADGIGIFLFDAKATFKLGGYGGSLGYAPNTNAGTTTGLAGGYLGIGLDEYGNFSNPNEGRVGGPGLLCNSVTLRGPTTNKASTTNPFLATTQLQSSSSSNVNSIDYNTITATRPTDTDFYRRVKITVMPVGGKYKISVVWRKSPLSADTTLMTYTTTTAPPSTLKVGFAASTGGGVNYHEIRNLIITTPGGVRVDANVDKLNAKVNDQLVYTINVYNSTTSYLSNLQMADSIVDGLSNFIAPNGVFKISSITFNNYGVAANTASGYSNGVPVTSGFVNPLNTTLNMAATSMVTFTIVGTITNLPAGDGIIRNMVGINPTPTGITDEDLTNNNFSVSTKVLNTDFVVNSTLDNYCADPVNGNTFTLNVSNNGTENSIAGNTVTVTDTLPAGLSVVSASGTGWTVANTGNIYTFTRTDALAYGASYPAITIQFKPTSGTSWQNKATVAYTGLEASATNNQSQLTLYPTPTQPVVVSPINYCVGSTATALTATGTNLKWFNSLADAGVATAPTPSTAAVGSKTYYVSSNNGSCESAKTPIVVNVLAPTSSTIAVTSCASYKAPDGTVYTTSGTKTAVIPNKAGCDSTITIQLSIIQPTSSTTNASICKGDSLLFNGSYYSTAGTYAKHLTNAVGCDSTATLVLTIKPVPTVTNTSLLQTVCSGTSTTLVTLTSDVPATTFEWTASSTNGITGFSTSGVDTLPAQVLTNPDNSTSGTVTYSITPKANGCTGPTVNYVVTVTPKPVTSSIYHE